MFILLVIYFKPPRQNNPKQSASAALHPQKRIPCTLHKVSFLPISCLSCLSYPDIIPGYAGFSKSLQVFPNSRRLSRPTQVFPSLLRLFQTHAGFSDSRRLSQPHAGLSDSRRLSQPRRSFQATTGLSPCTGFLNTASTP